MSNKKYTKKETSEASESGAGVWIYLEKDINKKAEAAATRNKRSKRAEVLFRVQESFINE